MAVFSSIQNTAAYCGGGCTASLLTPSTEASLRQLQCVDPSLGFLRVADRIAARRAGVSTLGFWRDDRYPVPQVRIAGSVASSARWWASSSGVSLDGVEGCAFSQHEDQLGAKHLPDRQSTGLRDAAWVGVLLFGEQDFAASGHDSMDANSLVMVTLWQATRGSSGSPAVCSSEPALGSMERMTSTVTRITCSIQVAATLASPGTLVAVPSITKTR